MQNKLSVDVSSAVTSDKSLSCGGKSTKKPNFIKKEYLSPFHYSSPSTKNFDKDLNLLFEDDTNKFLGTFRTEEYSLTRKYLQGKKIGVRLYYTKMEPHSEPNCQIIIVHGLSEHSGQFLNLGQFFAKNKVLVHLMDFGGAGYSGRKNGGINFEDMQEDLGLLLTQTREDVPLFVLGHSTGTLLALNLAINNPKLRISGIISSSVSLHPQPYSSKAKSLVSKCLLSILSFFDEDVTMLSRLNPTAQSKNNYTCIKMMRGFFKSYKITVATYRALESLSNFVREYIFRVNVPMLFVHGNLDSISNPNNSINLYQNCFTEDKTIRVFPNGYHMLFHDQESKEAKFYVLKWLMKRSVFARPFGRNSILFRQTSRKVKNQMFT